MSEKTTQITLSRALRLKNRLTNRINKVWSEISSNNSVLGNTLRTIDVEQRFGLYNKLLGLLIQLKSGIAAATAPIQEKLITLSEKRSYCSVLRALPVKEGADYHDHTYRMALMDEKSTTNVPTYSAILTAQRVETLIGQTEREIDALQDAIDTHNATVRVSISAELEADGVLTASAKPTTAKR